MVAVPLKVGSGTSVGLGGSVAAAEVGLGGSVGFGASVVAAGWHAASTSAPMTNRLRASQSLFFIADLLLRDIGLVGQRPTRARPAEQINKWVMLCAFSPP